MLRCFPLQALQAFLLTKMGYENQMKKQFSDATSACLLGVDDNEGKEAVDSNDDEDNDCHNGDGDFTYLQPQPQDMGMEVNESLKVTSQLV